MEAQRHKGTKIQPTFAAATKKLQKQVELRVSTLASKMQSHKYSV
jgi:hypothetical protein